MDHIAHSIVTGVVPCHQLTGMHPENLFILFIYLSILFFFKEKSKQRNAGSGLMKGKNNLKNSSSNIQPFLTGLSFKSSRMLPYCEQKH